MGYRDRKVTTKIIVLFAMFFVLLFPENSWAATYEHFIYQVRKTNGDVAPGVNVNVYTPGTSATFTVFSNITGTTVKSQPMLTDSLGNVDFYVGDSVVDILFTGGNIPTYKLLNVTLTALATAGVLTVPNGGTGAATFTLNTVLLGNGTLPIKTSSVGLANQVFRVPAAGGQPDFGTVNLSSSAAVSGILPTANGGTGTSSGSNLSVQEIDGSPNVSGVTNIRVSNTTLTDNGAGSVTVTTSGGGGGNPFADNTDIIKGSVDATKLLRFEVDGFTTATTRTLTPPNASVTIAGTDFANTWADGIKQTFNPSGTNSGTNVGAHTVDPSAAVNGDHYYNSTTNRFRCYENGVWVNCTNNDVTALTANECITSGLVACYKFDQGTGQVLTDYGPNALPGQLGTTGGGDADDPTWVLPRGLTFDGTNDFVQVPANAAFRLTTALSVEVLFRVANPGGGTTSGLFDKTGADVTNENYLLLVIDGTARGRLVKASTNFTMGATGPALVANQLYHLTITWDGTTIKQYIDANQIAETLALASPIDDIDGIVRIGSLGAGLFPLQGTIYKIGVYNKALSASEVSLAFSGSGGIVGPAGITKNIQYNDNGSFGGDALLNYDKVAKFFSVGQQLTALTDEAIMTTNNASHNGVIGAMRVGDTGPPGNSAGFRAYKARNTLASPAAVSSADWLLGLSSNAHDGTGYFGTGRLYTEATQTHTATAHGTRWVFGTTPNASTTITDSLYVNEDGGIKLTTGTKPTCDSTKRGYLFRVDGGAGVADTYEACDKDVADVYAWRNIHPAAGSSPSADTLIDASNYTLRHLYAQVHGASTTMIIHNLCDNGLTVVGTAANVKDSSGSYIRQTSVAAINNRASFICGQDQIRTDWVGQITFKIKTGGAIAGARFFIGLESTDLSDGTVDAPVGSIAWFRYSDTTDGTAFWRTYTNDNDASPTTTTTTAAIAIDTAYVMTIRWNDAANEVKFFIDGTLVATHTTNLPVSSTPLGPIVSLKNTDGNAHQMHWSYANLWFK